jgi:hypothetical protein
VLEAESLPQVHSLLIWTEKWQQSQGTERHTNKENKTPIEKKKMDKG